MNVDVRDIHKTLEYRTATAIVRLLPTGLLLIFLGLAILAMMDFDRESIGTFIGVGLCFIFGVAVIGYALWTRSDSGKPYFTLSPAGIRYRIAGAKEFLIPWREIRGVETIDVEAGYWSMFWSTRTLHYNEITFHDVTAVLVPKQFYDQRIHVKSFFLRGPGWKANFIPKGEMVQVALHHELVSVEPQALRDAVEARWLAFRGQPAPPATTVPRVTAAGRIADNAAQATPKSDVVVMGESPKSMPRWEIAKIAVLLIGIAVAASNLAGFWELPRSAEEREARAKSREIQQYWTERSKQLKEESKKLEEEREKTRKEIEESWRRFDRDRIMHGIR
jgi:hypothetical protein